MSNYFGDLSGSRWRSLSNSFPEMEVFLYNSTVCRLCGEENDSGTLLYSEEENSQTISELINTYLPIKVSDDGQLPRTICPGCTIQLEATVEFFNLIINGQKIIRELYQREKEYKKTVLNTANEPEVITEKIVYQINTSDGVYQVEHPIALQVSGLNKPKRKRGRPPKKPKSAEELAQEAAAKADELAAKQQNNDVEVSGKRRRKTPTRYKEAVQGKELERIFKEEGFIDGDESEAEVKPELEVEQKVTPVKEPEVIGHMETSGELVVVVKGKGRGRPKGRMPPTRKECAICGMTFSCVGRYMSHVAQHGPVLYQCSQCGVSHATLLDHQKHQADAGHNGQNVLPCDSNNQPIDPLRADIPAPPAPDQPYGNERTTSLPKLLPDLNTKNEEEIITPDFLDLVSEKPDSEPSHIVSDNVNGEIPVTNEKCEVVATEPKGKVKLKCNQCEKMFNSKQSRSLHIKAVHQGERPYACNECGVKFAYPRSLALHAVSHRRAKHQPKRYACDLCGKVLNHPSSVVYHKEAEHAGQRYVCNKCGKWFKHKQLLQRHQLVHSQLRPYSCKTCNSSFKTKANLMNHQLLHSGVKKFSCEICKNKFAHKTSLTLHMRWHAGSKPFSCKTCGKSFSQKGNLSEHERIHTGERPYACASCPRTFTTASQHRLHARRHLPDRPYACTHCHKRFVSRGSWLAHQRREAGIRSHACSVCARTFAERWALVKHMRKHTGERPFRCPHCPRTFADCSNLNKHKKQVHKQISLLVNSDNSQQSEQQQQEPQEQQETISVTEVPSEDGELEERVIYVTYDVDETEPGFQIMGPEQYSVQAQAVSLDDGKTVTRCELYSGPSLLVGAGELAVAPASPVPAEPEEYQLQQPILDSADHIAVTDEQGNPLHFTMQDGTRLAITSTDGKSLQVITQDGQTIPVEINEYDDEEEEESDEGNAIVHQMNLQKTVESNVSSPVTHYFTIV